MTFDDRIRRSLDDAGQAYRPGEPPGTDLAVKVERRRRRRIAVAGTGAAGALALVVGLVSLPDAQEQTTDLATAGRPSVTLPDVSLPLVGSTTSRPKPTSVPPKRTTTTAAASTTLPEKTTTSRPARGDVVVATDADNGETFRLVPGQQLIVKLGGDKRYHYTQPESDNHQVLPRMEAKSDPSSGAASGLFMARAPGEAHVSSAQNMPCHTAEPPCLAPSTVWQITVIVGG